jgi:hypothetical protein
MKVGRSERQKRAGPPSLCSVWFDTAIPFTQVLDEFEVWLEGHGLWSPLGEAEGAEPSEAEAEETPSLASTSGSETDRDIGGTRAGAGPSNKLHKAAFVTW